MLTVLTQGPPFPFGQLGERTGCLLGLRIGNRLITRHPLILVNGCLDQARINEFSRRNSCLTILCTSRSGRMESLPAAESLLAPAVQSKLPI